MNLFICCKSCDKATEKQQDIYYNITWKISEYQDIFSALKKKKTKICTYECFKSIQKHKDKRCI